MDSPCERLAYNLQYTDFSLSVALVTARVARSVKEAVPFHLGEDTPGIAELSELTLALPA
jgi:hypothetical protein